MIGVKTDNGIEYVTKLEHFRDLMDENVYDALLEFFEKEIQKYQDEHDYENKVFELKEQLNDIIDRIDVLRNEL